MSRWQVAPINVGPLVAPSVRVSLEALPAFVYRTQHGDFMRRRRGWFEAPCRAYMALCPVTSAEERVRRERLRRGGPAPFAFSFRQPFLVRGGTEEAPILDERA